MQNLYVGHGWRRCGTAVVYAIVSGMMLMVIPLCATAEQTAYVDAANTAGPWDGSQAHPYKTIASAIAQADATTVYVAAGTYSENLVITRSLQIIGASSLSTIIDGGGNGHTIAVTGTEDTPITVSISGFTIQNAGQHGFANIACSHATAGTIEGNTIQNSQEGDDIQLDHCTGLTISNNLITNAYVSGISLTLCSSCIVDANTIRYSQKGISLGYSTDNTVTGNTISHNTVYGVYLYQSSQNQFARNGFSVNSQQANDPCTNAWSIDQQGNTWDDYTGYDNNSNGIGDIPYLIPGGANRDDYPLGVFKTVQQQGGGETNSVPLVVSILVTPSQVYIGDLVSFSGEGQDSDGIIQGYVWQSSRDGQLGPAKSFTSSLLSVGVHTISLRVQDNDGAWSSPKTTTVTITALPQPVIDVITPTTALAGQAVYLYGYAGNAENQTVEYQWSSSRDGGLSSAASFSCTNLSVGVHVITLRIRVAGRDWSSPVSQLVTIQQQSDGQAVPPVADTGGPYQGHAGQPVLVDGSRSSSSSGAALSYLWNFGDGTTGAEKSMEHTYASPGAYNLTLTVSDAHGSATSTSVVTIVDVASETSQHPSATNPILPALPVSVFLAIGVLVFFGMICVVLLGLRRP